jgi:hypothetical protein
MNSESLVSFAAAVVVALCFAAAVRKRNTKQEKQDMLIIGISGPSRSGKSTLTHELIKYYAEKGYVVEAVKGDNFFKSYCGKQMPKHEETGYPDWEVEFAFGYRFQVESADLSEDSRRNFMGALYRRSAAEDK